jgi:hypothetical protein
VESGPADFGNRIRDTCRSAPQSLRSLATSCGRACKGSGNPDTDRTFIEVI